MDDIAQDSEQIEGQLEEERKSSSDEFDQNLEMEASRGEGGGGVVKSGRSGGIQSNKTIT
jgi:hypothetical protein